MVGEMNKIDVIFITLLFVATIVMLSQRQIIVTVVGSTSTEPSVKCPIYGAGVKKINCQIRLFKLTRKDNGKSMDFYNKFDSDNPDWDKVGKFCKSTDCEAVLYDQISQYASFGNTFDGLGNIKSGTKFSPAEQPTHEISKECYDEMTNPNPKICSPKGNKSFDKCGGPPPCNQIVQ